MNNFTHLRVHSHPVKSARFQRDSHGVNNNQSEVVLIQLS